MKVSVPGQRRETAGAIPTVSQEPLALPALEKPPPAMLPPQWWQSFLHGNPDAILSSEDARVASALIADTLGREVGYLEIVPGIRSSRLRKLLYEVFGADLRATHHVSAVAGGGQW